MRLLLNITYLAWHSLLRQVYFSIYQSIMLTITLLCNALNLMLTLRTDQCPRDIRQIMNETGQSASVVFEALGYKDEWDFLEDD